MEFFRAIKIILAIFSKNRYILTEDEMKKIKRYEKRMARDKRPWVTKKYRWKTRKILDKSETRKTTYLLGTLEPIFYKK